MQDMPRYRVERSFPQGLSILMTHEGGVMCQGVVATKAGVGVTWLHSSVNPERTKTFCV